MTWCLSPTCQQPLNPDDAKFCCNCGAKLLLGDRYRPIKPLGQGGFGRTLLAWDEQLPSHPCCVIKQFLMRDGWNAAFNKKAFELFRQEAMRLREVGNHPQIPELLAYLEVERRPYIVQSFVKGVTLSQELMQQGTFSEDQIYQLLLELLPVLQFIHNHRIIHRDVKPDNIIRPSQGQLNLVDFGAAKFVTPSSLKRTGTVIGSAGYTAPEQALGRAVFASDIYSLGVTCIRLLTGMLPFDLYSPGEGRWVWRDYLVNPVSDRLSQLLEGMMELAISRRYQSAAVVLHDLHHHCDKTLTLTNTLPKAHTPPTAKPIVLGRGTWGCVQTLCEHSHGVLAIAMHPDGTGFASAGADKTIQFWQLSDGSLREVWDMTGATLSLAYSRSGQFLASSSINGAVKVWNCENAALLHDVREHRAPVLSLCFSQDCELIVAQKSELEKRALLALSSTDLGQSQLLNSQRLNQCLVTGGDDGTIRIWHLHLAKTFYTLKHDRAVIAVAISPNGKLIASGSSDNTVKLWNLEIGHCLYTLEGHLQDVNAVVISPDGRFVISGSSDHKVKLWETDTGMLVRSLSAHTAAVKCLAISPDGSVLASSGKDGMIHLWNPKTGELMQTLLGHTKDVNAIAFVLDGKTLVSGSSDRTIKIWQ